jgi:hypothetical protein
MNLTLESALKKSGLYRQLKTLCDQTNDSATLTLINEVGEFSINRLKTVIKNMPEFTLHDETHIFNILKIIDKLIPESTLENLSIPDILMLILSVFLHDIGMAPEEKYIQSWKNQLDDSKYDDELRKDKDVFSRFRMGYSLQVADIERFKSENEIGKAQLLEDYIITEYIRYDHSNRARRIIADYWSGKIKYQDTDLTEDLASICFSHNEDYMYLLNMESFKLCGQDTFSCLPFVATLLRLADIIDFDPKRTPSVLFSHLVVTNPVSLSEWNKHQSINAWSISPKRLIYSAQCEHPAIESAIRDFCNQIDNELRNGTVVLSNLSDEGMDVNIDTYKIPLPAQVDRKKIAPKKDIRTGKPIYRYHDTKFSLSKKQIIDLLMGTKLYGKTEVALRELLQNSIDACLLREKLSEFWDIEYTPKIEVSIYTLNDVEYLKVSDNGIGMNQYIVDNFYTNIGCSYYSSREFSEYMAAVNTKFTPISRFGIGILSCFMVCDSMEVSTRRIKDRYEYDDALDISIEGYESLFVIKDSSRKDPGTETTLKLRPVNPWKKMSEIAFKQCIKDIVPNPAVEIAIKTESGVEMHTHEYYDNLTLEPLLDDDWRNQSNIKIFDIDLDSINYGFRGKGCISILVRNNRPVNKVELKSKTVDIDGEPYDLTAELSYGKCCIHDKSTMIMIDSDGAINANDSWHKKCKSKSSFSIHGIEIPYDLFPNLFNYDSKTILDLPFPFSFRLDIGDSADLNLNSARDKIIYDEKWLKFEENIYEVICSKLKMEENWDLLKAVIADSKSKLFKTVAVKY